MVTETIAVAGMTCGGCEQRVHDAEHIGDEVEVTFDPARLDVKAIRATIAAAGYRPSP